MRSDTLKRHMKTHEKKTNSIDQVTEYNSTIDGIALENKIVNQYQRKLKLGRKVKYMNLMHLQQVWIRR